MARHGSTLIELLVVLAVVGILLSLVPAALFRPARVEVPDPVRLARLAAERIGRPVATHDARGVAVLLLPDGRTIGHGYDPLTGEVMDGSR